MSSLDYPWGEQGTELPAYPTEARLESPTILPPSPLPIQYLPRNFTTTGLPQYTTSKPPSYRSDTSSGPRVISYDSYLALVRERGGTVQTGSASHSNLLRTCLTKCGEFILFLLRVIVFIILLPFLVLGVLLEYCASDCGTGAFIIFCVATFILAIILPLINFQYL